MSPRVKALLRLQSDDRLAALAAGGDEAAFEALVRRHRRWIVAACARVMPGDRAEDAAQQALLSAHQALLRNGPPRHPQAWLRRIALNAALKEAGRESPDTEELDEDTMDGVPRPEDVAETRELLTQTISAVGELPTRQRRALVMRELEGRSHAEIAAALGLSRGAIRQLIHRARDGVRGVATALTPLFLVRTGGASGPAGEIAAGSAFGLGAKAAVTVLVTGGIAGAVALAPPDLPAPGEDSKSRRADSSPMVDAAEAATDDEGTESGHRGSGRRDHKDDSGGFGREGGREGPDGDGDAADLGHSGSSSAGSGSGSAGGGSGGSGSGDGSGGSGSGSSGSGSVSSGSGSGSGGGGDLLDD